ncbi:hypothetical protein DPMN_125510 [Dreissena polymorpha]|uniref:Homeobox domain-containing protein n=1 Tax=Dreissena polymorpha TaxID=45954 RepID=A0A9D4GU39_DREPO|nr:hypothetical protein DPMN_125510 [Dreissena polymorpha]
MERSISRNESVTQFRHLGSYTSSSAAAQPPLSSSRSLSSQEATLVAGRSSSRRDRTTFTSDQALKLKLEYARTDYVSRHRRFKLAATLQLTESQIKFWFQKRRAKDERIEKAQIDHTLR